MKVLDWSLAQEIKRPHQATISRQKQVNMLSKRPYGQAWYIDNYYCKKGGHLVPKEEAAKTSMGAAMCPIHHQLLRHNKHRVKGQVDNRKRVDC